MERLSMVTSSLLTALLICGCAPQSTPGQRCGLLGCISSPYTKAKLHPSVVGTPIQAVIRSMGPPDKSYKDSVGTETISWTRTQHDSGVGTISCTEIITVINGVVSSHSRNGEGIVGLINTFYRPLL